MVGRLLGKRINDLNGFSKYKKYSWKISEICIANQSYLSVDKSVDKFCRLMPSDYRESNSFKSIYEHDQ